MLHWGFSDYNPHKNLITASKRHYPTLAKLKIVIYLERVSREREKIPKGKERKSKGETIPCKRTAFALRFSLSRPSASPISGGAEKIPLLITQSLVFLHETTHCRAVRLSQFFFFFF
jgi:hypothetical protein